jgi:hypothetical protein
LYKVHVVGEYGKFKTWLDLPLPALVDMLKPDVVIERYQQVLDASGKGAASNAFKMLQTIIVPAACGPQSGQGHFRRETLAGDQGADHMHRAGAVQAVPRGIAVLFRCSQGLLSVRPVSGIAAGRSQRPVWT